MDDAGIAPDECVLNSMVSACGRAAACDSVAKDALRRAFAVYDEMESSRLTCDAYTYASLIAGCVNAGEPERALELYERSGARKVKRTAAVFAADLGADAVYSIAVDLASGKLELKATANANTQQNNNGLI